MSSRLDDLRERRRETILEAAAACFGTSGFDGTGMAAIAKAASLSIGGVYRHFASKEDIVAALVERDLDQQLARLRRIIDSAPTASASDRVRTVVEALLAAQLPDRETAALGVEFCAAATRSQRLAALLADHADAVENAVRDALPGRETAAAADLLVTVLDGVMLRVAVAGVDAAQIGSTTDQLTEMMLATLAMTSPASGR